MLKESKAVWEPTLYICVRKQTGMRAKPGTLKSYAKAVFVGFDVLINAIFGGRPYQTLSCRVGESIMDNGWAARVPWSQQLKDHFLGSVHEAIV